MGASRVARPGLFLAVEAPRPRLRRPSGAAERQWARRGAFLAVEAAAFGDLETLVAVNAPQVNAPDSAAAPECRPRKRRPQ